MAIFSFNKTFLLWQINKAAGIQTQTTGQDQETDESEDEEEDVEDLLYVENDNESELSSDDGKEKGNGFCFLSWHVRLFCGPNVISKSCLRFYFQMIP